MKQYKLIFCAFFISFMLLGQIKLLAQCGVVINEIMINGPGACDCSCTLNNEEWTELYNSCSTPANIGCYVLTDGEFSITIPSGTILAPYDYYVIGSPNSGGTVDLDISTCTCSGGTSVGCYSNSNEQAILVNSSGVIQDAIYWGVGNFPRSITSTTAGSCLPLNLNFPAVSGVYEQLLSAGANGCTMARDCDAKPTWVQRCSTAITLNSSNGSVIPKFSATDSTVCPGTCINFTDLTTGTPLTWNWTFAGATAATNSSTIANPNQVCYNTPGSFPVTLAAITTKCGPISVSMPAFIQVIALAKPVISPPGPQIFCTGGSVLLQSTPGLTYQWYLNNTIIAGATLAQYAASTSGNYTVKITDPNCNATSLPTSVTVNTLPAPVITPLGATTICNNGTTSLDAGTGYASYQWLLNSAVIPGQTNQILVVSALGDYSVLVSNAAGCADTSAKTTITFSTGYSVNITATDTTLCDGQSATLSIAGTFPNTLWSTGESASFISVNQTGTYSVEVSNSSNCKGNDTVKILVTQLPQVDAGKDVVGDCTKGIELQGSGSGTLFLWSPAESLSDPNSANPIAKPKETTQYTLTVTEKECTSLDDVIVTIDCASFFIPNSFSPNADGNNDVYKAIGNDVSQFELRIFNRWGELVFESNQITLGWDGNYLGLPVPSGVYVRKVNALNSVGKDLVPEGAAYGSITLFR